MTRFRIDTVEDPAEGMIFAEIYEEPGDRLIARSEAIYHSQEEATKDVIETMRRVWPDKSPFAVDPTLGV
jgi:hypothetical protein